MGFFARSNRSHRTNPAADAPIERNISPENGASALPYQDGLSKSQLRQATRTRRIFALLASLLLLISLIFLVLVEIGNVKVGHFYSSVYFVRLDLSDIVPDTVPGALLLNTIAQTLGLHDYYQFGLWGFCEGYIAEGITRCSHPKTLYWFNPVDILVNELLVGATISLPTQATNYLRILKIASHVMFGLFLAGACLTFALIFLGPIVTYSHWWSLPISILALFATLCTAIASAIGTGISVIFLRASTQVSELNIKANVGRNMFVFMWVATASSLLALLFHLGMSCCCASRRDVKTGRKGGHRYVAGEFDTAMSEIPRSAWM